MILNKLFKKKFFERKFINDYEYFNNSTQNKTHLKVCIRFRLSGRSRNLSKASNRLLRTDLDKLNMVEK